MKTLKLVFKRNRLDITGVVAVAAALTFNNWLLGLLINRNLLMSGGSISELSVHSQSHSTVFKTLDIVSGILFVIFALLIRKYMNRLRASGHILIFGTIIFGIANCFDALFTLPCSETNEAGCHIPIHITWSHFNFPSHGYSSVVIGICYLALPIAGFVYAQAHKETWFHRLSFMTVVVAIISLLSAIWQYLVIKSFTVNASGWAQGAQMLVVGFWFVAWYWAVGRSYSKD